MLENLWDIKENLRNKHREDRSDLNYQYQFGMAIDKWEIELEKTLKMNDIRWDKPHTFVDLNSGGMLEGDELLKRLIEILGPSLVEKMSFDFGF